jgi:hypothetical protein
MESRLRLLCFIVLAFIVLCICDVRGRGNYRRNEGYGYSSSRRKGGYGYSSGRKRGHGYSSSRYVSPYPRCRQSRTKIQLVVLEENGTPVPYSKIDYVDATTMNINQRWTNNIGVLRFVVSGCEATLIVYSKKGDPTFHEVDLNDCKTGVQKETVVLRNTANFLVNVVPTEYDLEDDAYKWNQELVRYIYKSGKTTGEGQAVAGSGGAAPLAIKVEDGQDLHLMLVGQTGTIPAYLQLSSVDLDTSAEATMALPPFLEGTKEYGFVVGCNVADVADSGLRDKIIEAYVFSAVRGTEDDVEAVNTNWDCDNSPGASTYCREYHFFVGKSDWATTKDYLVLVRFGLDAGNRVPSYETFKGNCYVTDCNGKVKSAVIPATEFAEPGMGETTEPIFQIGCICKGSMKYFHSVAEVEQDDTTPTFTRTQFYSICNKCLA